MATANQIMLQQTREQERHDQVTEEETTRHNTVTETLTRDRNENDRWYQSETIAYQNRMAAIQELRNAWEEKHSFAKIMGYMPDQLETVFGSQYKFKDADPNDNNPFGLYSTILSKLERDYGKGDFLSKLERAEKEWTQDFRLSTEVYSDKAYTLDAKIAAEHETHDRNMEALGLGEYLQKQDELSKKLSLMDAQIAEVNALAGLHQSQGDMFTSQMGWYNAQAYNSWIQGQQSKWQYDNRWLMWGVDVGLKTLNSIANMFDFKWSNFMPRMDEHSQAIQDWNDLFKPKFSVFGGAK